jgi:hypothetical protein
LNGVLFQVQIEIRNHEENNMDVKLSDSSKIVKSFLILIYVGVVLSVLRIFFIFYFGGVSGWLYLLTLLSFVGFAPFLYVFLKLIFKSNAELMCREKYGLIIYSLYWGIFFSYFRGQEYIFEYYFARLPFDNVFLFDLFLGITPFVFALFIWKNVDLKKK